MTRRRLRLAIIGAGPGGLCMGKRLLDEGFDDFVVLEKSDAIGGTWHHNRYPGCECDIPSVLYSFSYELKTDWSKPYGTQPEILAYLQDFAAKYGLIERCRFRDGVTKIEWNETKAAWTLTVESGATTEVDVVVSAIGMFNDLAWPDIAGLHDFRGTMFHSARWNANHDLAGERVAVIGSAASAVQLVPEIVKRVARLYLFQRTANWVLPKLDDPYTPQQLEKFGANLHRIRAFRDEVESNINKGITFSDKAQLAEREAMGLAAIDVVRNPEVRNKLRPTHPYGCKRPLASNVYYAAFNEPHVELVTQPIERVTEQAVATIDGIGRSVDTIILATGFATTEYLSAIDVTGRDGCRVADAWADGAQAYLGIASSGFPNLFMLYGPNTNNGSILTMIEAQVEYILGVLSHLAGDGVAWVDVKPEAMRGYNDEIQNAIAGIDVWQFGCNGYYRTPSGRVVTQWPYSMDEFQRRTATVDLDAVDRGTLLPDRS